MVKKALSLNHQVSFIRGFMESVLPHIKPAPGQEERLDQMKVKIEEWLTSDERVSIYLKDDETEELIRQLVAWHYQMGNNTLGRIKGRICIIVCYITYGYAYNKACQH